MQLHSPFKLVAVLAAVVTVTGCSYFSSHDHDHDHDHTHSHSHDHVAVNQGIDLSMFVEGSFTQEPQIVDCTTSEGTETTCYEFVTDGAPAGREIGSFCPRNTSDGADAAGVFFNKEGYGELVDITGQYILNLASYYEDDKWLVYDKATNKVRYTATREYCIGAAQPTGVEEKYQNYCIECELSYLSNDFSRTFLIPTTPIKADKSSSVSTAGIALDGTELSGPAPVETILSAYTIAAFDDCGGHINPRQGYHYHASTGCIDNQVHDDGHAPLIGYAADGYAIYAHQNAEGVVEEDLDECRGQTDDVRGYHYHVATPSENTFISCLMGESVASADEHPSGHSHTAPE